MASTRALLLISLAVVWVSGLHAQAPLAAHAATPNPAWLIAGAQEASSRAASQPKRKTLWKASLLALAAAAAVDAHSSWGKVEANPLLANGQGRFGARGVAFKGLIVGGALGAQWILMKHGRSTGDLATAGAAANFAMAGIHAGVAKHNYGNRR